jgi:hypothetical protein
MEQQTINQRLNFIVDTFERGVKAAFARKAGISPQGAQELLAGRKGDPSFKVLVKILESYPTVDANWLVLGRGSMTQEGALVPSPNQATFIPSKEELEELVQRIVAAQLARSATADDTHVRKVLAASERDRIEAKQEELINRITDMEQEVKTADLPAEHIKWVQLEELKREAQLNNRLLVHDIHEAGVLNRANTQNLPLKSQAVYRITGKPDINQYFGGLLTYRLNITEEQAQQLLFNNQIRSTYIEDIGYRVTEQAVREFLGEA